MNDLLRPVLERGSAFPLITPVTRWLGRDRPGRTTSPVRQRRPQDLAACARLARLVSFEGQYPLPRPDAPRAWLSQPEVLDSWVVEQLGEIQGHVAISEVGADGVSRFRWREITGHEPAELLSVSRLFVRARARRRGIGTALLDHAAAEIRARGRLPVIDVVSCGTDAISLLQGRGWRLLAMDPWGGNQDRRRIFSYAAPAASPVPQQRR